MEKFFNSGVFSLLNLALLWRLKNLHSPIVGVLVPTKRSCDETRIILTFQSLVWSRHIHLFSWFSVIKSFSGHRFAWHNMRDWSLLEWISIDCLLIVALKLRLGKLTSQRNIFILLLNSINHLGSVYLFQTLRIGWLMMNLVIYSRQVELVLC